MIHKNNLCPAYVVMEQTSHDSQEQVVPGTYPQSVSPIHFDSLYYYF